MKWLITLLFFSFQFQIQASEVVTLSELQSQLQRLSKRKVDPYLKEYEGLRENVRFPVKLHQDDRYYLIDNIRTLGGRDKEGIEKPVFESGLIDIEKVKKVSWMMCVFLIKAGPIKYQAGHAQMVFEFEEGGAMLADGPIEGIINSFEIIPQKGVNYDPIVKGMTGYYDNSCTLSTKDWGFVASASRDTRIELYTLDLTHDEMKALLKISLREAFDRESISKEKYHTTRNSCVTNQFRILNLFFPEERRIPEWSEVFGLKIKRTFGTIVPRRVGKTLKKFGLVRDFAKFDCPDEAMGYVAGLRKQRIYKTLYQEPR